MGGREECVCVRAGRGGPGHAERSRGAPAAPPPPFGSPSALSPAPQLRARDPASRGDRYMLVTFEEPPYAIKVTPAHSPPSRRSPLGLLPAPPRRRGPLSAAAPPARLSRAAGVRGSLAYTGSGGGGGSADINMADIFSLCSVCEQQ